MCGQQAHFFLVKPKRSESAANMPHFLFRFDTLIDLQLRSCAEKRRFDTGLKYHFGVQAGKTILMHLC